MPSELIAHFKDVKILQDEPLANYTNTDTGGPADWLAFPTTVDQVEELINYANEVDLPVTVLGNASNLIVSDGGIAGLVIILTKMDEITVSGHQVTAQAGAKIIDVTTAAMKAGLSGLEFACGIPGSVGGAVFMNAGAYGGDIKQAFQSAKIITRSGELTTITNSEMHFSYRHSALQEDGSIVLSAIFELAPKDQQAIKAEMDDLNQRRSEKQPLEWPSCGSVFKRPEGYFAGKLIHDAGLQGFTLGGAQVSKKHAGFIINIGGGTASDYVGVIHHIQETVKKQFDVKLDTEVRIIGRQ